MPDEERPVYLTKDGLAKVEAELQDLLAVKRPEMAERIHDTKLFSSASDQAEHEDANHEQSLVENRIVELQELIRQAKVIDEKHHTKDKVGLGSKVKVKFDDGGKGEYTLVGRAEADPADGRISNESPVGEALLGRKVGDTVTAMAPGGVTKMKIEKIE